MYSWLVILFITSTAKEYGVCSDIKEWTRTTNTPSACDASDDMWGCYNHVECFWVAQKGTCESASNWQYHVGTSQDPASQACDFWTTDGDCWRYEKCFWNKHVDECQQLSQIGSSTSSSPTVSPTIIKDVPAMNMCEILVEHSACALNDDCVWSDKASKCLAVDGDCLSLHTQSLCAHNDACLWEDQKESCQSTCEQITSESRCVRANQKECFWMNDVCTPINAACNRLKTPSFCSYNEHCFWNELEDDCLSFYGSCDTMTAEEFCTTGDHCAWDVATALCIAGPEETTEAAIVDCEPITDVEVCEHSNSTEHLVPCVWSEVQDKCVEFKFDCEDFMTRESCNSASYGRMKCHWDGECDEVKLGNNSSEPKTDEINNFYLEIFAGTGIFLGVVGSLLVQRCWDRSRDAPEEYVDITLRSV